MFGSIIDAFRDLKVCFVMAVAVSLGAFIGYGTDLCAKMIGGNAKSCDKWKKAMFTAMVSLVLLILLKLIVGRFGGGGGGYPME